MSTDLLDAINSNQGSSDLVEAINTDQEPAPIYLPDIDSEAYTNMMRELNGEDMPPIETEEDLEGADAFEYQKMLQEETEGSLRATVKEAANGTYDPSLVQQRASQYAYETVESETKGPVKGSLVSSDVILNSVKAGLVNRTIANQEDYVKAYTTYTNAKWAVYYDKLNRLQAEVDRQGIGQSARDLGADVFIGYAGWKRSVSNFGKNVKEDSNSVMNVFRDIWYSVDNLEDFSKRWSAAIVDPDIDYKQLSRFFEDFDDYLKAMSFSAKERKEAFERMNDPDYGMARFEQVLDLFGVASMATEGVKGSIKGFKAMVGTSLPKVVKYPLAATAAIGRGTLRASTDQFFTVDGFLDDNSIARKLIGDIRSPVERAKLTGNTKKAVEEAIKEVIKEAPDTAKKVDLVNKAKEAPKGKANPAEIINDIKNYDRKNELSRYNRPGLSSKSTVFDDFIGAITKPDEELNSIISTDKAIKKYSTALRDFKTMYDNLQSMTNGGLSNVLQEALQGRATDILKDVANNMKTSDDMLNIPLIKAFEDVVKDTGKHVKASDAAMDLSGNVVARMRLPMTYSNKNQAEFAVESINKGVFTRGYMKAKAFPLTSGEYAIDIDLKTKEGWGKMYSRLSKNNPKESWSSNRAVGYWFTKNSNPKDINQIAALLDLETSANKAIGEATISVVKDLSKDDTAILNALLDRTIDTNLWIPLDDVYRLSKSKKITDAYQKLMVLDHLAFLHINDGIRTDMARQNIQSLVYNGNQVGYGVIHSEWRPEELINRLYNDKRMIAFENFDNAPADLKNLDMNAIQDKIRIGDYVGVEMIYGPNAVAKAKGVYYVVPKDSIIGDKLPAIVSHYVPGWRKYYSREATYLKQLNITKFDSQVRDLKSGIISTVPRYEITGVSTFAAANPLDVPLLEKNAELFNKIRDITAKNGLNRILADATEKEVAEPIKEIKKLVEQIKEEFPLAPFEDYKEVLNWMNNRGIDLKSPYNPLIMVKHGEKIPSIDEAIRRGYNNPLTPVEMDKLSNGSVYDTLHWEAMNMRANTELLKYDFTPFKHVDIEETVKYMVNDMINYGVLHRFDDFYASKFSDTFKDIRAKAGNPTAKDFLTKTDFKNMKGASTKETKLINAAHVAQQNYLMIKGTPTDADIAINKSLTWLLQKAGTAPDALKFNENVGKGMRYALDKVFDTNSPLSALSKLRTLTIMQFIMLGNTAQLLRNFIDPAVKITFAEPVLAAKAFKDLFKLSHRFSGLGPKDIEKLFDSAKEASESDYLFKNMIKLGVLERGNLGGVIEGVTNETWFGRASNFFFNKSDTWNRIMAADVALRKVGGHEREISSAAELARVEDLANTYYMNMSKAGKARVQAGELNKTALQFLGYAMRNVEAVLFEKNLTAKQKWSMFLGTLALGGIGGVFGPSFSVPLLSLTDWNNDPAEYEEPGEVYKATRDALIDGIPDMILHRYFDSDISIGHLFSMQIGDSVGDIFDWSLAGVWDKIPVVSALNQDIKLIVDTLKWTKAWITSDATYSDFSSLVDYLYANQDLWSSATKFYNATNLLVKGEKYSATGQLTYKTNSKLAALYELAGLGQQSTSKIYEQHKRKQNLKDFVAEKKKEIGVLWDKEARATSEGERDLYRRLRRSVAEDLTPAQLSDIYNTLSNDEYLKTYVTREMRAILESRKDVDTFGKALYRE